MKYGKDWICLSLYYDGYCDAPSNYECAKLHGTYLGDEYPRDLTDDEVEQVCAITES